MSAKADGAEGPAVESAEAEGRRARSGSWPAYDIRMPGSGYALVKRHEPLFVMVAAGCGFSAHSKVFWPGRFPEKVLLDIPKSADHWGDGLAAAACSGISRSWLAFFAAKRNI